MSECIQLEWTFASPHPPPRGHGGRRRGAGRKRAPGKRRAVPHRTRPEHGGRHPVHVTMRALRSLPSLRSERIRNMLLRAIAAQTKRLGNFRVVHFSIQRDHLHLLLEAGVPIPFDPQLTLPLEGDREPARASLGEPSRDIESSSPRENCSASGDIRPSLPAARHGGPTDAPPPTAQAVSPEAFLRSGMIGLATSLAKRLNRMLGRRGKVWDGRHHRRDLESPTSVRRALLYILQNHVHHGLARPGVLDHFSTARDFPVWDTDLSRADATGPSSQGPPWRSPRSWLLATGWLRAGGLLRRHEVPS